MPSLSDFFAQYTGKSNLRDAMGSPSGYGGQSAQPSKRVYGYEIRSPYQGEDDYFKSNTHVTGMAAEDGKITMNPYSNLTPERQNAVAMNEAARLFMREKGHKFDFNATPQQIDFFKKMGADYAKPENLHHLQSTIIGRIISGDDSAGEYTKEQKDAASRVKRELEMRR
jgi:hypothetical protein